MIAAAAARDPQVMVDDIIHLGLIEEAEIDLDRAALEIAALDHPGVDLTPYLRLLDRIEARLREWAKLARTPAEQASCLARVLAGEYGFEGDQANYDDPANADLIRVIDRRRGLPVSLAILYVSLARRLGWSAHALNTPNHVLVGLGAPPGLLIDPFNAGGVVRPGQLAGLLNTGLGRSPFMRPEHIAPLGARAVLVRLLMNQATRAEKAEDYGRALVVLERITVVAPGHSFGWWEKARLERAGGDPGAARRSLSAMLETTRDPRLRSQVVSALEALAN